MIGKMAVFTIYMQRQIKFSRNFFVKKYLKKNFPFYQLQTDMIRCKGTLEE